MKRRKEQRIGRVVVRGQLVLRNIALEFDVGAKVEPADLGLNGFLRWPRRTDVDEPVRETALLERRKREDDRADVLLRQKGADRE